MKARLAVKAVAKVTKGWAAEAKKHSAPAAEIRRLESAFDHEDLAKALALLRPLSAPLDDSGAS